jgi:alkylhydroperoxidase family enzyme
VGRLLTDVSRLRRELVARVLDSDATAARELRRAAFDNAGSDGPIRTLIEKVADRSYAVTDDDVAAVRASGLSEDQIFEVIVCAAIGAADRRYQAATAALTEASGDKT